MAGEACVVVEKVCTVDVANNQGQLPALSLLQCPLYEFFHVCFLVVDLVNIQRVADVSVGIFESWQCLQPEP